MCLLHQQSLTNTENVAVTNDEEGLFSDAHTTILLGDKICHL